MDSYLPLTEMTSWRDRAPRLSKICSFKLNKPYDELSVGVVAETAPHEKRVAQTPASVGRLVQEGFKVLVEAGAGTAAGFPDGAYSQAGASVVPRHVAWTASIVLKVQPPTADEAERVGNCCLISFIWPAQNEWLLAQLQRQGATCFAMDMVPRELSRAQTFDALTSQSNLAGYRAIIEAAAVHGRFFGELVTAAGRLPALVVLVLGGGVAGLSAITHARQLGAHVRCFDVRAAVKEQAESIGATFLSVAYEEAGDGEGGYAREMSDDWHASARAMLTEQMAEVDVIISTALVPGKRAPLMVTATMIARMRRGSVTVDLAAANGGNIETTVMDEAIVTPNGVTCLGFTNLNSRLADTSSTLFARNQAAFLLSIGPWSTKVKGVFSIEHGDRVVRNMLCVELGELRYPPPALPPRVLPAKPAADTVPRVEAARRPARAAPEWERYAVGALHALLVCALVFVLGFFSPADSFSGMLSTLALATYIGYKVVQGVIPAFHSPLMAATNAESGLTALGGMRLMGGGIIPHSAPEWLGLVATLVSIVNIVGGSLVTKKMLDHFRRESDPPEYYFFFAGPVALLLGFYGACIALLDREQLTPVIEVLAALLCIAGLAGLSGQRTARAGKWAGMTGVLLAVSTTLGGVGGLWPALVYAQFAIIASVGSAIGFVVYRMVSPSSLPQAVAGFHSLVGLAAVLTAAAEYLPKRLAADTAPSWDASSVDDASEPVALLAVGITTVVGGITCAGSIVAFAKLSGLLSSSPLHLPLRDAANALLMAATLAAVVFFASLPASPLGMNVLGAAAACSLVLGVHAVVSIGGTDMPVVITVLNSSSGWTLCAEGFMLNQPLLTIVGALIGASGALLTLLMCKAMNRSVITVVLGGLGTKRFTSQRTGAPGAAPLGCEPHYTDVEHVADLILRAKTVIIVPGYGLAVAKAQRSVAEIYRLCGLLHVRVRFAIHPVAGRMPGQLNVLLAEAGVPYDAVSEMDAINAEFDATDLALVVGANDTVNSAAEDNPESILAGMTVLRVWKAREVVIIKRSMRAGFTGVKNPVFVKPNVLMLLGDAKATLDLVGSKVAAHADGHP